MLIPPDDIHKSLATYNWQYVDNKISKTYSFDIYMEGIDFIQKIAELSERSNHHPDIYIGWCKVEISITSHEMGGVTTNCVNLATGIDHIFNK